MKKNVLMVFINIKAFSLIHFNILKQRNTLLSLCHGPVLLKKLTIHQ